MLHKVLSDSKCLRDQMKQYIINSSGNILPKTCLLCKIFRNLNSMKLRSP